MHEQLVAMGHEFELIKGNKQVLFGNGDLIHRRADKLTGMKIWGDGSDPRGDGARLWRKFSG